MFVSAPSFDLLVHFMQVGMCVVQVLESDLTSSQQDVMNITTHSRSQVSNLKTLSEDKEGKTKEAQQQHEAAAAESAAQLANLKTRMDKELAALTSQLESEQKRRVAAEEQHKAAQADLTLASQVAEHLKSDQAVLLTKVGVVSALVMQVLSSRYVMHWCLLQSDATDIHACCQCPICSGHLFEEPGHLAVTLSHTVLRCCYALHHNTDKLFCMDKMLSGCKHP